jgi:hypothetical protein
MPIAMEFTSLLVSADVAETCQQSTWFPVFGIGNVRLHLFVKQIGRKSLLNHGILSILVLETTKIHEPDLIASNLDSQRPSRHFATAIDLGALTCPPQAVVWKPFLSLPASP